MSKLDTNHVVNLDLVKDRVNSMIKFGLADVETSDFYLGIYNNGSRVFDKDYIVTLYIVKPNGTFRNIKLEPKEGLKKYYCNLPDTLKNIAGEYVCQVMVFDNLTGEKKISKSKFKYSVDLDLASEMAGIIDEEEQESILTNVLNRLLTLENPVEPYATQKHVDECVSTLTEEIDTIKSKDIEQDDRLDVIDSKNAEQDNRLSNIETKDIEQDGRLSNIETKNTEQDNRLAGVESKNIEQDNRLTTIEEKDVEQDGRLSSLENRVDGIDEKIVNTIEPNLDNHGNRLDALEAKDIDHESRMSNIESKNTEQDNRLNSLESKDLVHESRMTDIESKNTEQDERLNNVESKNIEQDSRLDVAENRLANIGNDITNIMQPIIDEHTSRLDAIEAIDVAQNNRLNAIESKNTEQDNRLLDIEKVNNRQDIDIKCLYGASQTIDVTKEGNSIYLQNSNNGFTIVDEIKGNTLVNCNKEPDKELILNGNINTSGDNAVTITEGVDGGLVDVALEGNTLVNVSKTKDSTAITKAYTVENSGNHIALQGDIDGSCRPIITGNTLVNLIDIKGNENTSGNTVYSKVTDTEFIFDWSKGQAYNNWIQVRNNVDLIQEGKTYTVIINILENNPTLDGVEVNGEILLHTWFNGFNIVSQYIPYGTTGLYKYTFSAVRNSTQTRNMIGIRVTSKANGVPDSAILMNGGKLRISKDILILEGDYTNKPIPDYFEGLQSSFEDNLVTQEMVDNGEDVADNLGKYKVEYKVTGKNKFDKSKALDGYEITNISSGAIGENADWFVTDFIPVIPNTSYRISGKNNGGVGLCYDKNKQLISSLDSGDTSLIRVPNNVRYIKLNGLMTQKDTFQIEEGDTVTDYEPYKEHTKTLYLNSTLLEGDTIEEKDGGIYHVHRSELVAYTEGDETSLITDKVNTLHQLETPTYELIEQSNLAIPSYANGHLDFDTAIPVEKVEFKSFSEELTYLYANTQYTVQFIGDKAITVDITLGGTSLLAQSILEGLNRISITTPSELVDNKLIISGVGANISEVVVTDTDREFGYFEGMKSVGECEELEAKSGNKNLFDESYRDFNNTILDGYRGYRFKLNPNKNYTLKLKLKEDKTLPKQTWITLSTHCNPNKIEASCVHLVANSTLTNSYNTHKIDEYTVMYQTFNFVMNENGYVWLSIYSNKQQGLKSVYDSVIECIDYIQIEEGSVATDYIPHQSNTQQLTHEPLRAVGDIKDRYVLIDGKWYIERNCGYNNIERYNAINTNIKGVTVDFTNRKKSSHVICDSIKLGNARTPGTFYINSGNIVVVFDKNDPITDEDMIAKVSQYNFIYQLATPIYEPLDYNPLEVYSDVTHISTNSAIPTNIVVKNHGYNCLLKPNTTYTISSNLGLNTVTTPSTLTEDCLRFMDTDTSDVTTMKDVLVLEGDWTTKADLIPSNFSGIESAFEQEYDAEKGKYKVNVKVANEDKTKENNITFYINEPLRGVGNVKDRIYVKDDKVVVQRNCGIRPYQDGDFGTYLTNKVNTVYQLTEPTYEEVEYNDTKLFTESFKNSTLFYNSNVPVTSTVHYSYSVPIVDTVAQTADISDQQDSMIIDLATQCAVMEIMLM